MIPNRRLKDNARASVDTRPAGKNHFNVLKASVRVMPVFATRLPLRDATELTAPIIRKNAANPNPEWGESAIKPWPAASFDPIGIFVAVVQHIEERRHRIFLQQRRNESSALAFHAGIPLRRMEPRYDDQDRCGSGLEPCLHFCRGIACELSDL
jgi:hypothetical protein